MTLTPADATHDDELNALTRVVDEVFGAEATMRANDRACARTGDAGNGDGAVWLQVFHEAWKDELRQLLRRRSH